MDDLPVDIKGNAILNSVLQVERQLLFLAKRLLARFLEFRSCLWTFQKQALSNDQRRSSMAVQRSLATKIIIVIGPISNEGLLISKHSMLLLSILESTRPNFQRILVVLRQSHVATAIAIAIEHCDLRARDRLKKVLLLLAALPILCQVRIYGQP